MKYTADFETTTREPATVWLWGIMSIDDPNVWYKGEKIEDFIKCAKSLKNPTLYFHNARFDCNFIIYWLLKNGFTWQENKGDCSSNCFTTLISGDNKFYSLDIYFYKGNITQKIRIIDSLKIIPISVKKIAQAFQLPVEKGTIDYAAHNNGGAVTAEEIDYLKRDLKITALGLKEMFAKGLDQITIGSCALDDYKKHIGGHGRFQEYFPELKIETDAEIRAAYKGGWCYVLPENRGEVIPDVLGLDKNGSYYHVMHDYPLPCGAPVRFEGQYKGNSYYPLYVQTLRCMFEIKPLMLPTLQVRHSRYFHESEYLESSRNQRSGAHELVTMTLTNVDLELLFEHYNVFNVEYMGGFMFKKSTTLFSSWIDKWEKVKEQAAQDDNEGLRQIAKLVQVNLYGKFGTNPIINTSYPLLDEERDLVRYGLYEYPATDEAGNVLTNEYGEPLTTPAKRRDPVYIPVAVFTTAWGRYITINAAQKIHEESIITGQKSRYIYSDTDSLYIRGFDVPKWLDVHPFKLGAWKIDSKSTRGKFLGQKKYMLDKIDYMPDDRQKKSPLYNDDGSLSTSKKIICAGMPDSVKEQVNFDNFNIGQVWTHGNVKARIVRGGVILEDRPYRLL